MIARRRLEKLVWLLLLAPAVLACNGKSQTTGPGSVQPKKTISGQQNSKTSVDDQSSGRFQFEDVAEQAGVIFAYRNGSEAQEDAILESLGGGVAVFDFDRDGWMDLFFPGGGLMEQKQLSSLDHGLFRNLGNFQFANVTQLAIVNKGQHYSHGPAVGDYDNDGFPDVVITGYGGVQFFRNQGDGTFQELTPAGLDETLWSSSAGWADLNGDQLLDLYICHYVNWSWENNPICGTSAFRDICSPRKFTGLPDAVYFNNGDGTFTDATVASGLDGEGKGLGVVLADIDQDGDVDIYVANDTTDNFLYMNDGSGKLAESARLTGTALGEGGIANGSMGVDVCDFNRDLKFDIWVANFESESFALYRNEGSSQPDGLNFFNHVSKLTGVTRLGGSFVGFGTAWADFDMDGDEDGVVSNGHVINHSGSAPRRQLPLLLLNDNQRINRVEFPPTVYFGTDHEGRGLALGDLDKDGDLDIALSNINDPVAVLRNDIENDANWLCLELIGVESNRFAIGAVLILYTDQGNQLRQIKGGGSYMSASDPRQFWGIPKDAHVQRLVVVWPSGQRQEISDIPLNKVLTLVEPAGQTEKSNPTQ